MVKVATLKSFVLTLALAGAFYLGPTDAAVAALTHSGGGLTGEAAVAPAEAVGRKLSDHILADQDGRKLHLAGLIGPRPLVISYIYTNCEYACHTMAAKLAGDFEESGLIPGKDFTSVTLGFDVGVDTPEKLKEYGRNFTEDFGGWTFVTSSDWKVIRDLTRELGFSYRKRHDGGIDHPNMVTVVDVYGRVSAQLYGMEFETAELVTAVKRASGPYGNSGSKADSGLIEKIKLFCYTFDENTGAYRIDYGAVAALSFGVVMNFITVGFIIYILFRRREEAV